jgi:membrane-associated PAP2 superfamily phosphatase
MRLWWAHLRIPLAVFVVLATLFATTHTDLAIARALYFDQGTMSWVGAHNWWINVFLHTGGRWAVRVIIVGGMTLLAVTWMKGDLRALRRPAAYFVVATVLSVAIVGLLKTLTNVDCPWDLTQFGGRFPYVELFADRPDGLRRAQCFPAAHASSGYALVALYFALRERHARLARLGLGVAIVTGLLFGVAQQARGAHFVSHDLWSAFLVWLISLSVYAFAFRARLWDQVEQDQAALSFDAHMPVAEPDAAPAAGPAALGLAVDAAAGGPSPSGIPRPARQ